MTVLRMTLMVAVVLGVIASARQGNAEEICGNATGYELFRCLSDSSDGRLQRGSDTGLFHPLADPEALEKAGATPDGKWVAPVSRVALQWTAPWQAFNAYSLPGREAIILYDGKTLLAISVLTGPEDAEACVEQGVVETLTASGLGTPVADATPLPASPVATPDAPEWMAGPDIAARQVRVDAGEEIALLAVGCMPGAEGAFVQAVHLGMETDAIASREAALAVIRSIAIMYIV